MTSVQQENRTACRACGSTRLPIVFGLPSDRAMDAAQRGELRLGGCALPHWPTCRKCGNSLAEAPQQHKRLPGISDALVPDLQPLRARLSDLLHAGKSPDN